MSLLDYVLTTVSIMLINAVVLVWLRRDLDDRLDALRIKFGNRCDNLAKRYAEMNDSINEHKGQVAQDLTRALTKAETANQLAHQANMTAGKAKQLDVVQVKFMPVKMRIRSLKQKTGNA
jgi:hypothetical protein